MNDTLGSLLDVSISSLNNAQVLTYNSISTKWSKSNTNEPHITNLTSDLSNCVKLANKGISYCGLGSNGLIPVVNISNLSEPQTSILNNDLNNKADRINGYSNNSKITLNIPLTINSLTTSNNYIPLTNGNTRQGTVNKYMTLPYQRIV